MTKGRPPPPGKREKTTIDFYRFYRADASDSPRNPGNYAKPAQREPRAGSSGARAEAYIPMCVRVQPIL